MKKAKTYDWKDSNLALFGSDVEENTKREAASSESAWMGSGESVGLEIWKIKTLKVEKLEKTDQGTFFNGDSYIILNTHKAEDSDELKYNVHFWIGRYSTQDEYGTAAYKTMELDTVLNGAPVQHREVQGHESSLFNSYFETIVVLEGGADTAFRKVESEKYTPRLLQVTTVGLATKVVEVPKAKSSLNSGDIFILDLGLEIMLLIGSFASREERFKAQQYVQTLKSERENRPKVEVLEQDSISEDHKFYGHLTEADSVDAVRDVATDSDNVKQLYRLSDASGSTKFKLIKTGGIGRGDFDSKDVFVFDTKDELFVWVGKGCSPIEKQNGIPYAHNYLKKNHNPLKSVTVVQEDQTSSAFTAALEP